MNPARRLVPLFMLLAFFSFVPAPAGAEVRTSPDQASKFVAGLGHQFETPLGSNYGASLGQHRQAFATLVRKSFDLELIGDLKGRVDTLQAEAARD
jgi:hypothetical protein